MAMFGYDKEQKRFLLKVLGKISTYLGLLTGISGTINDTPVMRPIMVIIGIAGIIIGSVIHELSEVGDVDV